MSDSTLDLQKILKLIQMDGLLSRSLKGFEPRLPQQQMMGNIIEAYNENRIALIEAGTGTGKSIAYLIPAIIWAAKNGERTVISTNTIALQEQLIDHDIPRLLKALNLQLKVVLVKGMSHYLCLRKLEDAHMEMPLFPSEDSKEIEKIEAWRKTTLDGARSDLPFTPSMNVWERVNAESTACSQHECPHYQNCFFYKARRNAQDAHLLIANHHLLFTDLMKRADQNNYSETAVLPVYKRIVLDEAHHIEDIATEHFSARLCRLDLMRILSKLTADKLSAGQGKLPLLKDKLASFFRSKPPHEITQIMNRLAVDFPAFRHHITERIHEAFEIFSQFVDYINHPSVAPKQEDISFPREQKLRIIDEHQTHSMWKDKVLIETKKLIDILRDYQHSLHGLEAQLKNIDNDRLHESTKSVRLDILSLAGRIEQAVDLLNRFFSSDVNPLKVRWIENQPLKTILNVHLINADLDVSKTLADYLFSKFPTIILCSATLSTNKKFDFIRQRLGIHPKLLPYRSVTEHIYESPFNYHQQALLATPIDILSPSHPDFNEIAFENIWKAIVACQGQAFVLFTSYAMLQKCAEALTQRLKSHLFPLFKQGDCNRLELLNTFRSTKRAVLFGTDSFWEGVDVAGDALRCVIIVKLPFKVPSEPIIQARTEALLAEGDDPFFALSVPHAIVKFKQGFGRLIRNAWDRGCIICLDNRLVTKGYGKLFLNSLPSCKRLFLKGEELWPQIADFYHKTTYLTKQSPFAKL